MIFQKNERRPRREHDFGVQVDPRWHPRRPKIAPRRVQDRLGSIFLPLEFSFRFLIVLVSNLVPFWPPKWHPGSAAELCKSALGRSKMVPRSSWFGPFFVLSFGIAFFTVLGSFWGRFWALRGAFWCFFGSSTHRFNPSTHQPMALRHFLTRPGGLRAARLNRRQIPNTYTKAPN